MDLKQMSRRQLMALATREAASELADRQARIEAAREVLGGAKIDRQ